MYNIWNYDYIQQQAQQQYHQNQVFQVVDTARKLQDFLDSSDKVDPQYKEAMRNPPRRRTHQRRCFLPFL